VVGKRYVRRAVQRNRIKRVIRESYRRHRAGLPSVDVAILLKRGSAPETDNSNLIRCLDELWKQLVARHHRATG
jgi:ribonuclease P protein component